MIGNPYLSRTIPNYGEVDYTYPVFVDDICLTTRKSGSVPNWKLITMAFTPKTWIGCFILFWIIFLSWFGLRMLHQTITKTNVEFLQVLFESFQIFIIVQVQRKIEQLYERLYIVTILWGLVILSVAGFQGNLSSIFTIEFNYPEVNTLKSALDHNLKIYVGNKNTAYVYFNPESPRFEVSEMGKRAVLYKDGLVPPWLPKKIKEALVLVRRSLTETGPWAHYFLDLEEQLHVVKECSGPTYNGYILKKHGILNDQIQKGNLRIFEGGFFNYWYQGMVYSRKVEFWAQYHKAKLVYKKDNMHILHVDDILIALIILLFGYILSFFVIFFEICSMGGGNWTIGSEKRQESTGLSRSEGTLRNTWCNLACFELKQNV